MGMRCHCCVRILNLNNMNLALLNMAGKEGGPICGFYVRILSPSMSLKLLSIAEKEEGVLAEACLDLRPCPRFLLCVRECV